MAAAVAEFPSQFEFDMTHNLLGDGDEKSAANVPASRACDGVRQPTRCAAGTATLPSNRPSTKTVRRGFLPASIDTLA